MFILPGYTLTSALFARQAIGLPERAVYSLGLSMVVVILGALVLNLTPSGLQPDSWTALLVAITVGGGAVALRRGASMVATEHPRRLRWGLTMREGVSLGCAGLLVAGAIAVAIIGAKRQHYASFTQLWLLPAKTEPNHVQLGIDSGEPSTMDYRLTVTVNGRVVRRWPSVRLRPDEGWEETIALPPPRSSAPEQVGANLFLVTAPTHLYRHVRLWIRPEIASRNGRASG